MAATRTIFKVAFWVSTVNMSVGLVMLAFAFVFAFAYLGRVAV